MEEICLLLETGDSLLLESDTDGTSCLLLEFADVEMTVDQLPRGRVFEQIDRGDVFRQPGRGSVFEQRAA